MSNDQTGSAAAAIRAPQPAETNPLDFVPDQMPFDTPYGPPITLDRAQALIQAAQACLPVHGRKIGNEKRPARNQPHFEAEWRWVCRMPGVTERLVVSSPPVCTVWAHRLLRQFSEPACVQTCRDNRASDHRQLRAG